MITYRKRFELDVDRATAPEPPFCCATAIRPYRNRTTRPITIDYLELSAFAHDPRETTITHDVRDQLERERRLEAPVLIEATGAVETVYRRGDDALNFCAANDLDAVLLLSADGAVAADRRPGATTTAIAAWPLSHLDAVLDSFASSSETWGLVLPVVLTITTELSVVADIASRAARAGAKFLTALPIDLDPTAKREIAAVAIPPDAEGEDTYSTLFGDELDPLVVATERHIAALAHEHGMSDYVVLPREERRDNWFAATMLARVAQRMFRMEREIELAWSIHRSSKIIAALPKPITHVAESASLGIIEGLDDASIEMLNEWLDRGESVFQRRIEKAWRLRRDLYR